MNDSVKIDPSKGDLLRMFQQRMDKCTNEQFWAVATLSALYATAITQAAAALPGVPRWLIAVALSASAFYGLFFVGHRHKAYYDYRKDISKLVGDCPFAPDFMKTIGSAWELSRLTGIIFYSAWIIGGYVVAMYVLLK
jgi:fatty acid desaturase